MCAMIDDLKYYCDIWYATKANSNSSLLTELDKSIDGFLSSSISYTKKLINTGVSPNKICTINVLEDENNLREHYLLGVRFFTVDNLPLVKRIYNFMNFSETSISIRLDLTEILDKGVCHLGASVNNTEKIIGFLRSKRCRNIGISLYFTDMFKNSIDIQKTFSYIQDRYKDLDFISIGGVSKNIDDIKMFCMRGGFNKYILEIGDNLVKDRYIETKILRVKNDKTRIVLTIERGLYTGFFDAAFKNKKYKMSVMFENNIVGDIFVDKPLCDYTEIYIFGGSGNYDDFLGVYYIKNDLVKYLKENLKIKIHESGAYFDELVTLYGMELRR